MGTILMTVWPQEEGIFDKKILPIFFNRAFSTGTRTSLGLGKREETARVAYYKSLNSLAAMPLQDSREASKRPSPSPFDSQRAT